MSTSAAGAAQATPGTSGPGSMQIDTRPEPWNNIIMPHSHRDPLSTTRLRNRRSLWATAGFALVVLVPSLYGFGGKFIELVQLYRGDVDGVFAISPILNYLLASLGFLCLFCWAITQGMFTDIESPKRTMLDIQNELDRDQSTSREDTV